MPAPFKPFDRTNLQVAMRNELVFASTNLTKMEDQLIDLVISLVRRDCRDAEDNLILDRPIEIACLDFAEMFGYSKTEIYRAMQDVLKGLLKKTFCDRSIDARTKLRKTTFYPFLHSVAYIPGAARIELVLHPEFIPYISRLRENNGTYLRYNLDEVDSLSSIYTKRFFRILSTHRNRHHKTFAQKKKYPPFHFSLIELREIFQLESQYLRVTDLKTHVLKPALDEIRNLHLDVSYTTVKRGREVVGFEFQIAPPAQALKTTSHNGDEHDKQPSPSVASTGILLDDDTDGKPKRRRRLSGNQKFRMNERLEAKQAQLDALVIDYEFEAKATAAQEQVFDMQYQLLMSQKLQASPEKQLVIDKQLNQIQKNKKAFMRSLKKTTLLTATQKQPQ